MQNLWIRFIKHVEKFESNFNYLKKKLKEVNRKIDNLRQLLLDVSDIFIQSNYVFYLYISTVLL